MHTTTPVVHRPTDPGAERMSIVPTKDQPGEAVPEASVNPPTRGTSDARRTYVPLDHGRSRSGLSARAGASSARSECHRAMTSSASSSRIASGGPPVGMRISSEMRRLRSATRSRTLRSRKPCRAARSGRSWASRRRSRELRKEPGGRPLLAVRDTASATSSRRGRDRAAGFPAPGRSSNSPRSIASRMAASTGDSYPSRRAFPAVSGGHAADDTESGASPMLTVVARYRRGGSPMLAGVARFRRGGSPMLAG